MRLLTDYGEQKPSPTAQAARKRITLSTAFQQVRSCAPTKPIIARRDRGLPEPRQLRQTLARRPAPALQAQNQRATLTPARTADTEASAAGNSHPPTTSAAVP